MELNNLIEKLLILLDEFNLSNEISIEENLKLILKRKSKGEKRYLWITPHTDDKYIELLFGFTFEDNYGLDGRRYGDFEFTLEILKFWIINWGDYKIMPRYEE